MMSMTRSESIICPNCQNESSFTLWESLNATLDPHAKELLLTGELFNFICPNCGYKSTVVYPILYHDMEKQVMIYLVDEKEVENTIQMFSETYAYPLMRTTNYKKRIVTDPNSLREKAIIFDACLDDRVIEILKLIYIAQAEEHYPNIEIQQAYFHINDGAFMLDILGSETLYAEIPRKEYIRIQSQFSDRLNAVDPQNYIINRNWAARTINSKGGKSI